MKLSPEEVAHIAKLARLKLSAADTGRYSQQLSAILDYVDQMQTVDTAEVEPTSQVTGLTNVTRADRVAESGMAGELLAAAPETENDYLKVPKVL